MGKLADGKRLSDHLRARFEGAPKREALESVKDVTALTKNHAQLAEKLIEDAGRRGMSLEKAREQIVVKWIEENCRDSGSRRAAGSKSPGGKAAGKTAAADDDDDDSDADAPGADASQPPAAG